jgi:hypothetical protein
LREFWESKEALEGWKNGWVETSLLLSGPGLSIVAHALVACRLFLKDKAKERSLDRSCPTRELERENPSVRLALGRPANPSKPLSPSRSIIPGMRRTAAPSCCQPTSDLPEKHAKISRQVPKKAESDKEKQRGRKRNWRSVIGVVNPSGGLSFSACERLCCGANGGRVSG